MSDAQINKQKPASANLNNSVFELHLLSGKLNSKNKLRRFTRFTQKAGILGLKFASLSFTIIVFMFIGGLIRFSYEVTSGTALSNSSHLKADAIVVLTGGQDRIKHAIKAIQNDQGKRLLITGVFPTVDLPAIARSNGFETDQLSCCIDIDHSALDTVGNAKASAKWAQQNNYTSLLIVTSNLHMIRTLMEFRHQMPDMTLIASPVDVAYPLEKEWISQLGNARIVLMEYSKFVAAYLRQKYTHT